MRVGAIIRKWRMVSELPVRDVADQIGIAASTLTHIEHGKTPPHSETLIALISWLIGDEKVPETEKAVKSGSTGEHQNVARELP